MNVEMNPISTFLNNYTAYSSFADGLSSLSGLTF
jgi:hypothetical protein